MLKNIFWNSDERRLRAFWRQVLQILLFFILSTLLSIILNTLLSILHLRGLINYKGEDAHLYAFSLPLYELEGAIAALLSAWLSVRLFNREPFQLFGYRVNRDWWLDCGFGLLLGFVLIGCVFLIDLAAGWISITGTFVSNISEWPFAASILGPLVLIISAAFYEETLFRSYAIRNLAQGLNTHGTYPGRAIVLIWIFSSICFGLFHSANPHVTMLGVINIGLAGLLFGLSYILTGSLALSLGIHFAWDFSQGCIFGMPVAGLPLWKAASVLGTTLKGPEWLVGGAFGSDSGLLVTLAFLLGMIPVLLYVRWRYGKIALHTPLATFAGAAPATQAIGDITTSEVAPS